MEPIRVFNKIKKCECMIDDIRYNQAGEPVVVYVNNLGWFNAKDFVLNKFKSRNG